MSKTLSVFIPEFEFNVTITRLPDNVHSEWNIVYQCDIPIYHPAVFQFPRKSSGKIYGRSTRDIINQLANIKLARRNPCNIDASISCIKDPKSFKAKNMRIFDQFCNDECPICLDPLIDKECINVCLNDHLFHKECVKDIKQKCPNCRREFPRF